MLNKNIRVYVLALFLCIISTLSNSESIGDASIANSDIQITNSVKKFMQQYGVAGAAVIIYKNNHIYKYFLGVSDLKKQMAVDNNTIFELGSITKTFTGLLFAEKITTNEINLQANMVNYLDNSDTYSKSIKKISLLDLATHSSGLPYNAPNVPYNAPDLPKNKTVLNSFLKLWNMPYPPANKMLYSNLGFGLLGIALAHQSQVSLSQLMQKDILDPLSMNSAALDLPKSFYKYYAQGYTASGGLARTPNSGILGGSWAMKASAEDMGKYLAASLGDPNTPNKIALAMKIAQTEYFQIQANKYGIGLGWIIIPLDKSTSTNLLNIPAHYKRAPLSIVKIDSPSYNSHSLIYKTGSTDGFRSYIGLIPYKHVGIVILTNRYISNSGALQNTARQALFDLARN